MTDVSMGFLLGSIHWWLFRCSLSCLPLSAQGANREAGSGKGANPARALSLVSVGRYWVVGLTGILLVTRVGISARGLGSGLLAATGLFLAAQTALALRAGYAPMETAVSMEKKI